MGYPSQEGRGKTIRAWRRNSLRTGRQAVWVWGVLLVASPGWAQTSGPPASRVSLLAEAVYPDSPGALRLSPQAAPANVDQMASGSVSGEILDIQGNVVPNAKVTLASEDGRINRVLPSGADGKFLFEHVTLESYRLTVTAPGLETFVSNSFKLSAGEHFALPHIDLPLEPANASVTVTVTEDQLATEQVHEQAQQRVLGILPNFYTSFLWNAAPMRAKQKYSLALRSSIDPFVFASVGVIAGIEQANHTFPGYGRGVEGYAKRYGAQYSESVTGRFLGGAVFPSLLHQDPRYFYLGSGTKTHRALYALREVFVCRGDNGKDQPNVSHLLGNFSAAALANLYRTRQDRTAELTFRNGAIATASNGVSNLLREFLYRSITTHVADYKRGRPVNDPE